jgi:hypothetical protein
MGIFSERNLYAGVNPHLNSFLQNPPDSWSSFHFLHIVHLFQAIDDLLPSNYYAMLETAIEFELMDDGEPSLMGIVIFEAGRGKLLRSAVTRIELLTPENKASGTHYKGYAQKRVETVQSGINLIEIDYLHETSPLDSSLPDYSKHEPGSNPFSIHLIMAYETNSLTYVSHVDCPLPTFNIPLLENEFCVLDLNNPYNYTCTISRHFRSICDYTQLPLAFDRYSPADQERIKARMAAIAAEANSPIPEEISSACATPSSYTLDVSVLSKDERHVVPARRCRGIHCSSH